MAATDSATIEKTTRSKGLSRMFLWFDLHAWEHWLLVGVGIVAIGGVVVAAATYAVIKLQRAESAQAKRELIEYQAKAESETAAANAIGEAAKRDAADANKEAGRANERTAELEKVAAEAKERTAQLEKGVAEANARAAEAQLALERFKAPRSIAVARQNAIAAKLRPFAGQKFDLAVNSGDPEAVSLAETIEDILTKAGWEQGDWKGGDVVYSRADRRHV